MRKRARDRVIVLSSIFNPSPAPPHKLGRGIFLRPQASIFRGLASRCRCCLSVEWQGLYPDCFGLVEYCQKIL